MNVNTVLVLHSYLYLVRRVCEFARRFLFSELESLSDEMQVTYRQKTFRRIRRFYCYFPVYGDMFEFPCCGWVCAVAHKRVFPRVDQRSVKYFQAGGTLTYR